MPIARARKKGEQAHFDTEWTLDRIRPNTEINRIRERVDRWRQGGYVESSARGHEHGRQGRGGFGRWGFVEVTDPWDALATIRGALAGNATTGIVR